MLNEISFEDTVATKCFTANGETVIKLFRVGENVVPKTFAIHAYKIFKIPAEHQSRLYIAGPLSRLIGVNFVRTTKGLRLEYLIYERE